MDAGKTASAGTEASEAAAEEMPASEPHRSPAQSAETAENTSPSNADEPFGPGQAGSNGSDSRGGETKEPKQEGEAEKKDKHSKEKKRKKSDDKSSSDLGDRLKLSKGKEGQEKGKSDPGGRFKLNKIDDSHAKWLECIRKADGLRHSTERRSHFQRVAQGLAVRNRESALLMVAMRGESLPSLYGIAAYWSGQIYEVDWAPGGNSSGNAPDTDPILLREYIEHEIQRGAVQAPAALILHIRIRVQNCPWFDLATSNVEYEQFAEFCRRHSIQLLLGCIVDRTRTLGAYIHRRSWLVALPWAEQWVDAWRAGRSLTAADEPLSAEARRALDEQAFWHHDRDGDEKRAADRFFGQLAHFQQDKLSDVEAALKKPSTLEQERKEEEENLQRFRLLLQSGSFAQGKVDRDQEDSDDTASEEGRALIPYLLAAHAICGIIPARPTDFGLFRRIASGVLPDARVPIDMLGPAEKKRCEALHKQERKAKIALTALPTWNEYLSRHFDAMFRKAGLLRDASGCVVQSRDWRSFSFGEHIFAEAPNLAASTAHRFLALLPSLIPKSWSFENVDRVSWNQRDILDIVAHLRQRMGREFDDRLFAEILWRAIGYTGDNGTPLVGDELFLALDRRENIEFTEAALTLLVRAVFACRNVDPELSNDRSRPHAEFLEALLVSFGEGEFRYVALIRFLSKLTLSATGEFLADDVRLLLHYVKRRAHAPGVGEGEPSLPWQIVREYFFNSLYDSGLLPSQTRQWVRWLGALEEVLFEDVTLPDELTLFQFRSFLEYTLNCDIADIGRTGLSKYDDATPRMASELVFDTILPGSEYLEIVARRYFPIHPGDWPLLFSNSGIVEWRFRDILSVLLDGPVWPDAGDGADGPIEMMGRETFHALACACHLPELHTPRDAASLLLSRLKQKDDVRSDLHSIARLYGLFRTALLLHWRLSEFGLETMQAGGRASGKFSNMLRRVLAETNAENIAEIAEGLEVIASTLCYVTAPIGNAQRDGIGDIYEAKADAAHKIAKYLRHLSGQKLARVG